MCCRRWPWTCSQNKDLKFCIFVQWEFHTSSVWKPILLLLGIKLPTQKNSREASKDCGKTEHESKRFRELINRKLQYSIPEEKTGYNPAVFIIKLQASLSVGWNSLLFESIYLFHPQLSAGREPGEYLNPSDLRLQMNRSFLDWNKH